MHCGHQSLLDVPECMARSVATEIMRQNLDLDMALAHECAVEEVFDKAFSPDPDPMDVLEAIREYTYMIAAEGPEPDMLSNLSKLVAKLWYPPNTQKDSKGE